MIAAPILLAAVLADSAPQAAERRGKPFWIALARDCAVPAGETAAGLVNEAVTLLGSPDSEWRDAIGYDVVASCIYGKSRLSPEERRALTATLSANLSRGIGATGDDSVLLRSFSALDLSILAAAELKQPALVAAGYQKLVDDAFAYLAGERDLRGFEPRVGWIHATAHTADLLKFLARDSRFSAKDHARLLDAVWSKLATPGTPVFTHAEAERLAATLVSLVRRADFDAASLEPWLARFPALEKELWAKSPPDAAALDASENARHLLQAFYVLLSLPEPVAAGGQAAAREKALAALAKIRR